MRDAIREAIRVLGDAAETAEDQTLGGDTVEALTTAARAILAAITLLAPHAKEPGGCPGLPFGPHDLVPVCGRFAAHDPHALSDSAPYLFPL